MEYRDGMFQLVLAEYRFVDIREAFLQHVRRKPDLPTPSDIVNLVDPPPQPLSAAVYVRLRARVEDGEYLLADERAYCRAFEAQEMAKVKA